jgi:FKBP-type peptidyl-prolyl cis-trans isomerase FklB
MTDQEKRSYAIGANVARNLKQQGHEVLPAFIAKGLLEEMEGKSRLTDAEVAAVVQQLRTEVQQKRAAEQKKLVERGRQFLTENAKKEGVKTLARGVQYRVLKGGDGPKPTGDDTVLCHFRGMRVDGTVFEASAAGRPSRLAMDQLIPGLREALEEMPVGSKWEVVIPPKAGYGQRGAGAVGPNETVIFEVELVGIEE